jgi:hypothetical protein
MRALLFLSLFTALTLAPAYSVMTKAIRVATQLQAQGGR